MGISEKLITIAENTPKVYNQGHEITEQEYQATQESELI